jgi:hypothetical protein
LTPTPRGAGRWRAASGTRAADEQVVAASQRHEIDPDELQTWLAWLSEQQAKRASDPDWQPPSITEDEAESDGPVDLDGLDGVGR